MGIVIPSLPNLQGCCRIGGDDKCMRSMLKNKTRYANVRDYQILDLISCSVGRPSLKQDNICKAPGSHLAHSRRTSSKSRPGSRPLIWASLSSGRSKVPATHLYVPCPTLACFATDVQSLLRVQGVRSLPTSFPSRLSFPLRYQLLVCFHGRVCLASAKMLLFDSRNGFMCLVHVG